MDVNNQNPFREAVLKFYRKYKREIIDKLSDQLIEKTYKGKTWRKIMQNDRKISARRYISKVYFFIPHSAGLEIIYETMGVKDFNELFATETDINNYLRTTFFRNMNTYEKQEKIEILSVENFDGFDICYIDGMILNDEIIDQIELRIANQKNAEGDKYAKMPNDVFRLLVLNGDLKGPELIALCSTNQNLRNKCNHNNYFIFRELLKTEFQLTDLHNENPREIYIRMHQVRRTFSLFQTRLQILEKSKNVLRDYTTPYDILYGEKNGLLFICLEANIMKNEKKTYAGYMVFMRKLKEHQNKRNEFEKIIKDNIFTRKLPSSNPVEIQKLMKKFLNEKINIDRDDLKNCMQDGYVQLWLLSNVKYDLRIPGYSSRGNPVPYEDFKNDVATYVIDKVGKKYFENAIKDAELIGIDLFHLTPEELDMLVTIHEFVMKGILSITYPLEFLVEN